MNHEHMIRQEFSKQAKDFSNKQLTLNNEQYLQWMISSLHLHEEMNVLDVAAGTGILSRAMAPFVKQVTSIDISEDMIREGITQNRLQGISNINYFSGNVEHLPFENNHFDLVISRFAFHHFIHPSKVLQEMKRVCQPDSAVCIIDMVSPEDYALFESYNHYERLRDPSHTYALKVSQLLELFEQHELDIGISETVTVDINVDRWLALTRTDQETSSVIIDELHEEVNSNAITTGLFPFMENGELMFKQTWAKIQGMNR